MCIIYSCYKGVPTKEEQALGAEGNVHGAGICWIQGRGTTKAKVHFLKGLKSDPDVVMAEIEKRKLPFPYAIHYRSASIGGVCDELTHPFPITDDVEDYLEGSTRRVLMHNGHISDWKKWFTQIMFSSPNAIPVGPWSDSRALAAVVNAKGEGVLEFIIEGSRVLVMDAIPSVGCPADDPESYIRTYGTWIDHPQEGYAQSTSTYKRPKDQWTQGRDQRGGGHACGLPILDQGRVLPSKIEENAWTVDELETLVGDLRKEQDAARVMLGC